MSTNSDRTFIKNFDNFIYASREALFFGGTPTLKNLKQSDKELANLKKRLFNMLQMSYIETQRNGLIFYFDDYKNLKNIFADFYSLISIKDSDAGDYIEIAKNLSKKNRELNYISEYRDENRIRKKLNEYIADGTVLSYQKSKSMMFCRNFDVFDGLTYSELKQLKNGLMFAINKNNYSCFASSLCKVMDTRYNIIDSNINFDFDHMLFHPILDEFHVWPFLSAIHSRNKINVTCTKKDSGEVQKVNIKNLIPISIVYDTLYGRSYFFVYDEKKLIIKSFRADRIFNVENSNEKFDICNADFNLCVKKFNEKIKTAWNVSIEDSLYTVKLKFKNKPSVYHRLINEKRHGTISKTDEKYLYFEINVNNYIEMKSWILSYGSDCVVLEPSDLKNNIISTLMEMSNDG